jgi:membrane protease YdiL (CAAX protease family)
MDHPGNDRRPGEQPTPPLGIFDKINNYLLLFYAAACLLMYFSLQGFFYAEKLIALSLILPGILTILVPFYLLSQRSPFGFVREFRMTLPRLLTLAISVVAVGSAVIPMNALQGVVFRKWPQNPEYISFLLSIKPKGPGSLILVGIGIVVVAAIAEELLFRGFIQRILERNMGGPLAVILTGVLFALMHFDAPAFLGITGLGILFCYIFYRTRNLWNSILAHACFNAFDLWRLNAMSPEEISSRQTETTPVAWLIVSVVVLVGAVWALRRVTRGSAPPTLQQEPPMQPPTAPPAA